VSVRQNVLGLVCDTQQVAHLCRDWQLGDWERSDDAKAVHRKLSPNCPMVLGMQCGNVARAEKVALIHAGFHETAR
jgi:predicted amidohydrolase YtcJ